MGKINYTLLIFSGLILFSSCKSTKITTTGTVVVSDTLRVQTQPVQIPFDSIAYFASLIPDTVDLTVHRLKVDTAVIMVWVI